MVKRMSESVLRIGVVYPEVLGTYGDTGNATVLRERAVRRGIPADVTTVSLADVIPSDLDIYVLGGGEDTAQALAASRMRDHRGLVEAARLQRPILAICASLQVLGERYTDAGGREVEGLGLLDVVTRPRGSRAIGELVEQPLLPGLTHLLTGFENHGGGTTLGPDANPLGTVLVGIGNGSVEDSPVADDSSPVLYEGAVQGSIVGTYLHGPALVRNPQLADYLLALALGVNPGELDEIEMPLVERLRKERLHAVGVEEEIG